MSSRPHCLTAVVGHKLHPGSDTLDLLFVLDPNNLGKEKSSVLGFSMTSFFLLETRLVALILFVVLLATQSSPAYDLEVLSEAISFFLEIHHRKTPCSFLFNFLSFFLEFCERCGHETTGDLF